MLKLCKREKTFSKLNLITNNTKLLKVICDTYKLKVIWWLFKPLIKYKSYKPISKSKKIPVRLRHALNFDLESKNALCFLKNVF